MSLQPTISSFALLSSLVLATAAVAEQPSTWMQILGSYGTPEHVAALTATDDGGVVAVGSVEFEGREHLWVVKMDADGFVQAERVLESPGFEAQAVVGTADGGFFVAGEDQSPRDVVAIRFGGADGRLWGRRIAGAPHGQSDYVNSAVETADGGFLLAGYSYSFTDCVSVCGADAWLVKLSASGEVQWEKIYGDGAGLWRTERFYQARQTADGGYLAIGYTDSLAGYSDQPWAVKLDPLGRVEWEAIYMQGGTAARFSDFLELHDGRGYLLAGQTLNLSLIGKYEAWAIKIDLEGEVIWQRAYGIGDTLQDIFYPLLAPRPGGFLMAAETDYLDGGPLVVGLTWTGEVVDARIFEIGLQGYYAVNGLSGSAASGFYIGGGSWEWPDWVDAYVGKVNLNGDVEGCSEGRVVEVASRIPTDPRITTEAIVTPVRSQIEELPVELVPSVTVQAPVCPN